MVNGVMTRCPQAFVVGVSVDCIDEAGPRLAKSPDLVSAVVRYLIDDEDDHWLPRRDNE
jgi:hypothetical protein